ncbi:DUF4411 family protein [Alishewanella jeotgali]|jgi:hypothetical protein|uniref:Twitching motility protein PilT n=1 Tax=Alishewanella jeotgali KCTC 22429 TaxID=1129374 RepID=H3ZEC4_9ALTE|nr:DUF4411 family protein [Alishewanella jeotgali]EHR41055.1 twitching motility protein PilT [Alishewanella jeotgali KCTC 22429]
MSYILDSDVLITAKNSYYAFDLCPGFWRSLLAQHHRGHVYSLDRNRQELLQGREDDKLVAWVHNDVPANFFLSCSNADVVAAYTEVMLWVQRNPQFHDGAKAKFATGADGWLVAYARVYGHIVVTLEESRPEARNQIKLPDVCIQFGVTYQNVFSMLRALSVEYDYKELT